MVVRVFRNILAKKSVLPSMSKPRRNFYLVCLDYTLICMSLSVGLSVCVIKSVCSAQAKIIHTHPLNGPLSGATQVSRYQKGKTNLDFTEARDSEWQWHQLGHMQVCSSHNDSHSSRRLSHNDDI